MSTKSVVILTTGLAYGGAETQVVHLATRLRARGWAVRVVSLLPPHAYVDELKAVGIVVDSLGMSRGVPDPRALVRLARILRRDRPQVLHAHMVHANILARVVRLLVRVPVVICTAHNISEGGRWRELAYRLTDVLCDLTSQVSQAGMERYIEVGAVPAGKIRVIPNGVDTERFRPNPDVRRRLRRELRLDDRFAWLAVGRFEKAKDYPNMVKAFARVVVKKPNASLLIAGQGSLRVEALRLVEDLGLAGHVHFLGLRKDVPALMNAADGYVMSSAWEGMPMVLLEAAATGLPIVATDVGGNHEVVLNGRTGFLVPPKDPQALAQAMLRLMETSEEDRARMGAAGRAHVMANYTLERVVDMWEALYGELLNRKRLRS